MSTLADQIACVKRELAMRQRVYPGLVDRRRMSPDKATVELAVMGDVLRTLERCVQLADCLDQARRDGEPPEGVVRVSFSDTLVRQIAAQLRGAP